MGKRTATTPANRTHADQHTLDTQAVRAALRKAGLRATVARLEVYAALARSVGPRTHHEICDAVSDSGLDRATIYRNLVDLTSAGLVRRTDHGDHLWRFELLANDAHSPETHPHFVCTDCGVVECLPEAGAAAISAVLPARASRHGIAVQVRGHCGECR